MVQRLIDSALDRLGVLLRDAAIAGATADRSGDTGSVVEALRGIELQLERIADNLPRPATPSFPGGKSSFPDP